MLENILIKYFDLQEDYNDIEENEEKLWNNSYNKLIDLLYDLDDLGVITDVNKIIDKLDKIDSEVF